MDLVGGSSDNWPPRGGRSFCALVIRRVKLMWTIKAVWTPAPPPLLSPCGQNFCSLLVTFTARLLCVELGVLSQLDVFMARASIRPSVRPSVRASSGSPWFLILAWAEENRQRTLPLLRRPCVCLPATHVAYRCLRPRAVEPTPLLSRSLSVSLLLLTGPEACETSDSTQSDIK